MPPEFVKLAYQLGFGVLIFFAFMVLLKWVLKQQEKILDNANGERIRWQEIMDKYSKEIEIHTSHSKDFYSHVKEAHKYQREEHRDLSAEHKGLMNINNHISTGIKEAVILLQNINGRKRKR